MNILLRSSPETSPKIPAFKKQIKNLKTKNPVKILSLEHACTFFLQACVFAFFLLSSKGPHKTCNQENSGQQQLILVYLPEHVSSGHSFASVACFLSPWCPAGSLLLFLCLCFQKAKAALRAACSNLPLECTFALHAEQTSSCATVLGYESFLC